MWRLRARFTSCVADAFYAAVVLALWSSGAEAAERQVCALTMDRQLGIERSTRMRAVLTQQPRPASVDRPQDRIARGAVQDLSIFKKHDWLDPQGQTYQVLADVFIEPTETLSADGEVLTWKFDERLLCLLGTGVGVFLSDEVTHHYATVYSLDPALQEITFIDPWNEVSFLREGRNVAGVSARAWTGANGEPFLNIRMADAPKLIKGLLFGASPPGSALLTPSELFDLFEAAMPEKRELESYIFWKYSRLIASGDKHLLAMAYNGLNAMTPLQALPRLADLRALLSDIAVLSSNRSARSSDDALVMKIENYAAKLPWPLCWLLIQSVERNGDLELRLKVARALMKARPHDANLMLQEATDLRLLNQIKPAADSLSRAYAQASADISDAVSLSSRKEAREYLSAHGAGLMSADILLWTYFRISLEGAKLALRVHNSESSKKILDESYELFSMGFGDKSRAQGEFLRIFLDDLLEIKSYVFDQDVNQIINAVLSVLNNNNNTITVKDHESWTRRLYRHFVQDTSILRTPPDIISQIEKSDVKSEICSYISNNHNLYMFELGYLKRDLIDFCLTK